MKAWVRPAFVLGFAAGGLFDGILLHQILQWHHLLSLVPGVAGLRGQVLWDGYFHAFLYLAGGLGIAGLWRSRARLKEERWKSVAGVLLFGFAAWHTIDSVVSHWWLGIHRIRIDSPDPLLWDLIWLVGFGIVPAIVGALLVRQPPSNPPPASAGHAIVPLMIATLVLAVWSLIPPDDKRFTTVVFAPWVTGGAAITAIGEADGRLVWTDPALAVMVVEVPSDRRLGLYAKGALLVSGGAFAGGCIDWSRPPA